MKKRTFILTLLFMCLIILHGQSAFAVTKPVTPSKLLYQYFSLGGDSFLHCRAAEGDHDGFEILYSKTKYFYSTSSKKKLSSSKLAEKTFRVTVNPRVYKYAKIRTFKYNEKGTKKYYSNWSKVVTASQSSENLVDLWIGDSRTVAFFQHLFPEYRSHVVGRDYPQSIIYKKCIAKDGQGYRWLTQVVYSKIINKIKQKPNSVIVVNLGVNDYLDYSADDYIKFYQKLMLKYPQLKIYCMSINPVASKYKKYKEATMYITKMNAKFKKAFGERYINTNGFLKYRGFETVWDGLHYQKETSLKIHNYTLQHIRYHK